MTSHSELPRFIVLAVALGGAASCSSSRHEPPEPIGYAAGPARPHRRDMILEGRVEDPPAQQYAAEPLPLSEGETSFSYLDNPNLAGGGRAPVANAYGAQQQSAPLQAIDQASSDPGLQGQLISPGDQPQSQSLASGSDIPEEGINIDAELGIGAEAAPADGQQLLLPPQQQQQTVRRAAAPTQPQSPLMSPPPAGSHFTIAEDNPSQTVVDGIGTDDPVVVVPNG